MILRLSLSRSLENGQRAFSSSRRGEHAHSFTQHRARLQGVSKLSISILLSFVRSRSFSATYTHHPSPTTISTTQPPPLPNPLSHILLSPLSPIPLPLPPLHSHLPRPQRLRQPARNTPTTIPGPRLTHPTPTVPAIPTIGRGFARRRALGRWRGRLRFTIRGARGGRWWCCVRFQVRAGRPAGGGFVEAGC